MHSVHITSLDPYSSSSRKPFYIKCQILTLTNWCTWEMEDSANFFHFFYMVPTVVLFHLILKLINAGWLDIFSCYQENKVYLISRCQLKIANKKFSNIKNDYEMTFGDDTKILPCEDDDSNIPTIQYNFVKLDQIQNNQAGDMLGTYDFGSTCPTCCF